MIFLAANNFFFIVSLNQINPHERPHLNYKYSTLLYFFTIAKYAYQKRGTKNMFFFSSCQLLFFPCFVYSLTDCLPRAVININSLKAEYFGCTNFFYFSI